MTRTLDENLQLIYTDFNRDHNRLREELLDSLPSRPRPRGYRFILRRGIAAAVAASILIAGWISWNLYQAAAQKAGQVRTVFGLVSLDQNTPLTSAIRSGQWIETHSGSQAEVFLSDRSRLLAWPRTLFQIGKTPAGQQISLTQGFIRVEAAKQAAGKHLTVDTPGSKITVLGTRFDVHVIQKPDGRKQTRVSVSEGKVNLQSGGESIILPPNTEGIAGENQPPLKRSLTPEVNEMIRLIEKNKILARQYNLKAGTPAIVDFNGDGSVTLWIVASPRDKSVSPEIEKFPFEGITIIKISNVKGLFKDKGRGIFELTRIAAGQKVLSLLQFRLPSTADIKELSPKPVETRKTLSRLIITVPSDVDLSPKRP